MPELILLAGLSLAFGFTSKFADLTNEHGLPVPTWLHHALGPFWGAVGGLLVLYDRHAGAVVIATTLYWFIRVKLEYFNHASAGVVILLAGLYATAQDALPLAGTALLFAWLTVSGYLNTWLKRRYAGHRGVQRFLRLRIRYYLGPAVYTVLVADPAPLVSIVAGMAGTEALTTWFDRRLRTTPLVAAARGEA